MPQKNETRNLIAALDIGTSKTVVLIGEAMPDGPLEVIGVGMHDSSGMKNGMVINIDAVVGSIRRALVDAELMAGCKMHKVYTSITGNHITSSNAHGMVKIKDGEVSQTDIDFVIEAASSISLPSDQFALHILEQEFCIDGQEGIRKPLGMSGRRLGVDVHIVTGAVAQNITKCVQCCGLEVSKVILQTLASSKAVLSDDDKELGVCLVDIGGGTTNVAIFTQGAIRHTSIIPIAGDHITNDIAKALRTTTKDAEYIKIKYGCALSRLADGNHIEVPDVGEQGNRIVPRQILAEIIEPRVKELYKLVHTELLRSGHYGLLNAGIVITGGVSNMHGMVELGEEIFHLPVRMGIPCCVGRLSDAVKTPQFSTAVGLLMYGLEDIEINAGQISHDAKQDPLFEAIKQLVIETRIPSISFVQRTFRINYSRAASMLEAMEGEIVTTKDENGWRRMLMGETKKDESLIIV